MKESRQEFTISTSNIGKLHKLFVNYEQIYAKYLCCFTIAFFITEIINCTN